MPQKTSLPTVQPQPYGNAKPGNRTMPNNAASFLLRYSCAAVSIALATWVRRLLDPALGLQFPYATIYFAVLVTAWYGGFRPALVSVILGALSSIYFLLPSRGSFAVEGWYQQVGMVLYLSTSLGIALLGGGMHAARRRAEASAESERRHLEQLRIAERKRAEAELREAEERMRSVVDHVIDGIITIDEHGTVETFNPAGERLFATELRRLSGRT